MGLSELKQSARSLMHGGVVVWASLLSLAVGLSAAAVVFSAVDAVVLRALPFPEPDRLVAIRNDFTRMNLLAVNSSVTELRDWESKNRVFSSVGAYAFGDANLTGMGSAERVRVGYVTSGLFPTLGAAPQLGRNFEREEDEHARGDVVILSHRFWKERFSADPGVLGKTLQVDGTPHTVIGVMGPGVAIKEEPQLWATPRFTPEQLEETRRGFRFLSPVARLKDGVTLEQAQADLRRIVADFHTAYPEGYPEANGFTSRAIPLRDQIVGRTEGTLYFLLGGALILLLGACANVANLLLARSAARRRELAVRTALGASPRRLVGSLMLESLLLGAGGWVLAMLFATWGVDAIGPWLPEGLPRASAIEVGLRTGGVLLAAAVVTAVGFGTAPAFEALRSRPHEALKSGRSLVARARVRSALVIGQVALAALLVTGATLMVRSFQELARVQPGFDSRNVLTARLAVAGPGYETMADQARFFRTLIERVGALPGVTVSSGVTLLPLQAKSDWGFRREGRVVLPPGEVSPNAEVRFVMGGYFDALRIPVLEGRSLAHSDDEAAPHVFVVNRAFVKRFFPGEQVIGQRIRFGGERSEEPWGEIVGVVDDVREHGLDQEAPVIIYGAVPQAPLPPYSVNLVVRSNLGTEPLVNAIRAEVQALDASLPVYEVASMERILWRANAERRFATLLLGLFAVAAMVLAAIGLFGLMQHSVAARTAEIGLRVALGATGSNIGRLVLGKALSLALAGVALGAAGALVLAGALRSQVYGISERDPVSLLLSCAALMALAVLAAGVPLRRALRTDPAVTLKAE